MPRGLTDAFLNDLETGALTPVLERLHKDHTLDLEIRENYVNIYYRGGSLMRIAPNDGGYAAAFDEGYGPSTFAPGSSPAHWVGRIPELKDAMDYHLTRKQALEREFQQLVVRVNNDSAIANGTDYFVIDIEYDNQDRENRARFDLVLLEWESSGPARKLEAGCAPRLALVEMKFGDNALTGNAGMVKHLCDFEAFLQSGKLGALKTEMVDVFQTKRRLNLVKALDHNDNEIMVDRLAEDCDYIFLIGGHDPASSVLKRVLDDVKTMVAKGQLSFEPRFCTASFMGYALYKQNVFGLRDFCTCFDGRI